MHLEPALNFQVVGTAWPMVQAGLSVLLGVHGLWHIANPDSPVVSIDGPAELMHDLVVVKCEEGCFGVIFPVLDGYIV